MMENVYRILLVDDEGEIRRFLRASLISQQHEVIETGSGASAIRAIREFHPDLVILDLGLPDMDGVEVTKRIRIWNSIPIIILSVRNQEADKIEALNSGADDYLTKPFAIGELLARIRVVMRRSVSIGTRPVYQIGGLHVDLNKHGVSMKGKPVELTPTEFDILSILVQNAGKVITQRQLIHKVWGAAYESESRLLRVNISNLRRKIEPNPDQPIYILTELGVGYRMKDL